MRFRQLSTTKKYDPILTPMTMLAVCGFMGLSRRGTASGRHSFVRAELHSYRQRVDSAGRELAEVRCFLHVSEGMIMENED